ncbi:MAG: glycosyltransferase [Desulfosarcina sp.]|nr:glycosyltransferase [Desulfobacterales bacterium]
MTLQVTVLDMQPIDPPVGGGRIRLLGLYHNLGLPTKYIGTYDWRGEKYRDKYLSETLREILIPLSELHFAKSDQINKKLNGKNVIDCTFHQLAHESKEFINKVYEEIKDADIIIFSHPWIYPLVRKRIKKKSQLVIYDSQNVEGYLRTLLLDDGSYGTEVAKEVAKIEYLISNECDLILTCSHEDRVLFNRLYDVPFNKMRIVPNGVFNKKILPSSHAEKKDAKRELGLSNKKVALFIGSFYEPNMDAAKFICFELAVQFFDIYFVICGNVCEGISKVEIEKNGINNIILAGYLSETNKCLYLKAADFAINPIDSGSGTNIKMFDFFAAGIPTITTQTGGRGIPSNHGQVYIESTLSDFALSLQMIKKDISLQDKLSLNSRRLVDEKFAWERISPALGILLERAYNKNDNPYFSVIIATYERHEKLVTLMKLLAKQSFKNFEVIIIDQSKKIWEHQHDDYGLDVFYLHTDIKGAVKARNTGATYTRGRVFSFTDDDCIPDINWLSNSYRHFNENEIIGIEGVIKSDNVRDPHYRTVSNEGLKGIGFMTANLHLRAEVFQKINGFDEDFDLPHFREDTDLAWRALQYGAIPYADDVVVLHPSHRRDLKRESKGERNKFFIKDALLLKKHPKKYKELFFKEGHYNDTNFRRYFRQGIFDYNVKIPDWCSECFRQIEMQTMHTNGSEKLLNNFSIKGECLIKSLLKNSNFYFEGKVPKSISSNFGRAEEIVEEVAKIYGDEARNDYFATSRIRYKHYFSAAFNLSCGSKILEIGSAPGHVTIGLHLMGLDVTGINLNEIYRQFYPSPEWLTTLNISEHDFEKYSLPYDDNAYDALFFTEVLEHVAIKNPVEILKDFKRVLKPEGLFIFSTPNVCNISNIYALLNGENIFWKVSQFYGSLDRHNREYTPEEVVDVIKKAGFSQVEIYGFNCHSNWRGDGNEFAYKVIEEFGENHPLLLNTIMIVART